MEFFPCINLIFKSSSHNFFANFFNTFNKEWFELISFKTSISFIRNKSFCVMFFFINYVSKLSNKFIIICLKRHYIFYNMVFNISSTHFRFKDFVNEFFKLNISGWNPLILTSNTINRTHWFFFMFYRENTCANKLAFIKACLFCCLSSKCVAIITCLSTICWLYCEHILILIARSLIYNLHLWLIIILVCYCLYSLFNSRYKCIISLVTIQLWIWLVLL